MLIWCAILFLLGISAFLDSIFNYGEIFRQINSVFFMLVSLALLVRTTSKIKARKTEKFIERIEHLERELDKQSRESRKSKEQTPTL
jgi:phage-related holin